MGIFEEETWEAAPEVNQLEDGLFGTVGHKMRKKRKGQKMVGDAEKKLKLEALKVEAREGNTPKKKKRGKRGVKKSKKKKEVEGKGLPDIDDILEESNPRKKKLRMKNLKVLLKENAAKGIFSKTGKAKNLLRNKYKFLSGDSKLVSKEKSKLKGINKYKGTDIVGEWVSVKHKQGKEKPDVHNNEDPVAPVDAVANEGEVMNNCESTANNETVILNKPKKLKKKKGIHKEKETGETIEAKKGSHQKNFEQNPIKREKGVFTPSSCLLAMKMAEYARKNVTNDPNKSKVKEQVTIKKMFGEENETDLLKGKEKSKKKKIIHKENGVEDVAAKNRKIHKKKVIPNGDEVEHKVPIPKIKGNKCAVKVNQQEGGFNVTSECKEAVKKKAVPKPKVSSMASTPVSSKAQKQKRVSDLSEGVFTKIVTESGSSLLGQSTKKKRKQPTSPESQPLVAGMMTDPAKKRKVNKLAAEEHEIAKDLGDVMPKGKKKKDFVPASPAESTHGTTERHSSPPKTPFNIDRLKHALEKPSVERKVSMTKATEGSPLKAKAKQTRPLSLSERMNAQLSGAHFRYINEQLYTCTGAEAQELMRNDPQAFKVYHEGFESQVEKWPQNPVTSVIRFVKARPKAVVADLGCGDAKLAQNVTNKVHSFDLVAVNNHVTTCDIADVPLASGSIDMAVFCLALMGTNLLDFICEANRILKKDGILIIAEVVSRFEKVGSFVRKLHKLGFDLTKKDDTNKMFIWFEFSKTQDPPPPEKRPVLELSPCVYKKR